ncbi:MAG: VWA domain-containing protein [Deltaproteobacteria bacterium]|nr:VWA domain-containing protein [Deltaproteobacteria bacterium]MBW2586801.1 VWA domain-containing protein [Deltaproteobacteria bacterium]MBW2686038.1 VWA domain-containing protein [Deltaproteobacteria bacterium]
MRWLWCLFVFVGCVGLAACAGSGGGGGESRGGTGGAGATGGEPTGCESFSPPPAGCDESCLSGSDSECQAGTFCNNGVCSAQCTATEGCGANEDCNGRGRCVLVLGGGGSGGTGNTGGNSCQSVMVTPTRSIPNVMFLVDQSSSMRGNRWEDAHAAVTGTVSGLESIVRFGLTTYTADDGGPPCPELPTQVDFALDNSNAINAEYPMTYPRSGDWDTPTGESLDALVVSIEGAPPPAEGPTIIVLATDGEPNTCADPFNQTTAAKDLSVEAAGRAHDAGFDVFVLSVGNGVSDAHLQEMANVGVGLARNGSDGDAQYWRGNDAESLEAAFTAIIADSISCEIRIDKPFDDKTKACDDPESDVRLNGNPLSCPSEWEPSPDVNDFIRLNGSTCAEFKSGQATFTAEFPCGAIVVE